MHFCGRYICFGGGQPKEKRQKGECPLSSPNGFGDARLPSDRLEENVRYIGNLFAGDDTLQVRTLSSPSDPAARFVLVYIDGMVNNKLLNEDVIRPLLQHRFKKGESLTAAVAQSVTLADSAECTDQVEKIVQGIVYGDTVLFAEGCADAVVMNTKGWKMRSITEPESERVLRGPREGFNESLLTNLTMLHRKLRTPDLKMRYMTFGRRTRTKACVCYLNSVVNRGALEELQRRLKKINIDGVLDTNYLVEEIRDSPYSAVKTVGVTERPDVVAGKLLEGRVALFLDGTPDVLTVPHLFVEHFQSDEDYYLNFMFASIGRFLRILAFTLSTSTPAIYIAMVNFHQEMLPTPLLISISSARRGVPFPTALEITFMLIVFEMLRESGARMPGIMGQTLSIVGALVVGQAAVDAKLVSAPIIIIVALTGITGLMVPRLKGYVILHRFALLFFSCVLGLYGYLLGELALLAGLFGMSSLGVPIMADTYAHTAQDYKDLYYRVPWKDMILRPQFLSRNKVRQTGGGRAK